MATPQATFRKQSAFDVWRRTATLGYLKRKRSFLTKKSWFGWVQLLTHSYKHLMDTPLCTEETFDCTSVVKIFTVPFAKINQMFLFFLSAQKLKCLLFAD